ncbi:hypothetical protein ACIRD2_03120 [Streptomyces sp. NPDC093595]|uniref:DUF6197 family protein n=1 Tax=Streptomyces sp. NPDC093595 TaxID=3366045 RepID=UPI00381492FE
MATKTRTPAPARPLSLDERLALAHHVMDARLGPAAVAFEVNTAHLPGVEPLTPTSPITAPQPAARPYSTPIAAVLQRAHKRLLTAGWCTGQARDEQGALCLVGAIRAEVGRGSSLEGSAAELLLETIRREFTDAETVPSWNDTQPGPAVPLRILGAAADQAAARGI